MIRPSKRLGNFKSRRAVAAAELALTLPILILAILGIIEFGRAFMVQQVLTNAAREGARRAILPNTTNASVATLVDNYLVNTSLGAASRQVQILDSGGNAVADLRAMSPRSVVTVRVSMPHDEVGLIGAFLGGSTLQAQCHMRKET